jgi:hypothetical protein
LLKGAACQACTSRTCKKWSMLVNQSCFSGIHSGRS